MSEKFAPKGVYSAMMTPFDENGTVSVKGLEGIVDLLVEKGADGVFPVSNVGEFLFLNREEQKLIIKTVTGRAAGRLGVIPGISDLDLDKTIEMAGFCKECGADGVVVCAPYYYPFTPDYVYSYLKTVADESPLPIILYNSPKFTTPITDEHLIQLISHPNVTAVKESSGDVRFLLKLVDRIRRDQIDVSILLGWEELLYTGLSMGACGCVVSCGGIVPEILKKLYNSYLAGDQETAFECERSINVITEAIGKYGFPYGYKMGVRARGVDFKLYKSRRMSGLEEQLEREIPVLKEVIDRELARCAAL